MIIAKITGQSVHLQYDEVVSDSARYLTVRFEFDSTWDSYTKKAVFTSDTGEAYKVLLCEGNSLYLGDNTCFVPFEVIASPCFTLSVIGVFEDSIVTTDSATVEVVESGASIDEQAAPTIGEYQQIVEIVTDARNIAQSVRADADSGTFIGEKGDKGDKGDQGENGADGYTPVKGVDYFTDEEKKQMTDELNSSIDALGGKKIVYDGDSICESRSNNGGGYAKIIADTVGCTYTNNASSGKRLTSAEGKSGVVDEMSALPTDGDLYCFEGGYNDYWTPAEIGECDPTDYTGELDVTTVCGALETIFRYALNNFVGKPICFVITHRCGETGHTQNSLGYTFDDYRKAMIAVCEKYSIPYYDAFTKSGLNGWNSAQSNLYLTANTENTGDGIHPNEAGYKRYYVPQLIELFKAIMPIDATRDEPTEEITNQIPISIDTDGSVFNGKGWIEGKRISSSGEVKDATSYNLTGYIPITYTDKLYIGSGIWNHETVTSTYNCVAGYTADFTFINVFYDNGVGFTVNSDGTVVYDLSQQSSLSNVAYVRVCGDGISDTTVITKNQKIV